jgi:hypothetical protein
VTVVEALAPAERLSCARTYNVIAKLLASKPEGRLVEAELDVLLALMADRLVDREYTKSYVSG